MIETWRELPETAVVFEVDGAPLISDGAWKSADIIAFGGASFTFPPSFRNRVRIPSRRPCLIGDQAIAIALYERGRDAAAQ